MLPGMTQSSPIVVSRYYQSHYQCYPQRGAQDYQRQSGGYSNTASAKNPPFSWECYAVKHIAINPMTICRNKIYDLVVLGAIYFFKTNLEACGDHQKFFVNRRYNY